LPILVVFFYRNLMGISDASAAMIMELMLNCLSDDNVEVREMASSSLSGIVRVSQRQSIIPLKVISNRLIAVLQPHVDAMPGPLCKSCTQSETYDETRPRLS
jgi:proteasome activator subunit 4